MRAGLSLVIAGVVGGAIGWIAHGAAPAPPRPPPPAAPVRCEPTAVMTSGGGPEVARLQAQLDAAQKLLRAQTVAYEGAEIPWPPGLGAPFAPSGVEASVTRALAACPQLPLKPVYTDCSEFPCMVWFERSDASDSMEMFLGECPAWTSVYGAAISSAQGQIPTAAGPRRYWMIAARPADWPAKDSPDEDNWAKRFPSRIEAGKAELSDRWQGTPD